MKRQQALINQLWQRAHRSLKRQNASVNRPLLFWLTVTAVLLCGPTESVNAAIFNIANGDVAALKAAINTANTNGQHDTINLATNGTYTLTTVDNTEGGANGLPAIHQDPPGTAGTYYSVTINGNGATIARSAISGTPTFRIFSIYQHNGGSVTINNLTIANGYAAGVGSAGGGINLGSRILTVQDCTFNDNRSDDGGAAINNTGSGQTVTVLNSTFLNNDSADGLGSILNYGTLAVSNSTFANSNPAIRTRGAGGANTQLTNCTFSANGYAIIFDDGNTQVTNCTFGGNVYAIAAIDASSTGAATVGGSILKSTSINLRTSGSSTITSQGYNLSSDNGGGFLTGPGDQINTNPQLDPAGLQYNGGPTPTIALLQGSPAIDKGNSFGLTTDQRGQVRPYDFPSVLNASDGSDIGAYEASDFKQADTVTLQVTTTADHDNGICGISDCTLREAINAANSLSGDNTITFLPTVTGTIQLGGALPTMSTNINLQGPGANNLTVRRNTSGNYRVFTLDNPSASQVAITVSGLTIENGLADFGGGIYSYFTKLTVNQCHIKGNTSTSQGGGIFHYTNYADDTLTVTNTTLSANSGSSIAGAIANLGSGVATVTNCTFSGNNATNAGAIINNGGNPGAVLNVRNCTFFGNNATNGASIYNYALPSAGGSATTTVGSSIFQAGSGANFINSGATFTSVGYNMSNDSAGGDSGTGPGGFLNATGDIRNTNPLLGSLQNNGGPTFTHALLSGSPAIDKGRSNGLTVDQRGVGYVRTVDDPSIPPASGGDNTDIGAFEFGALINAVSRKIHNTAPTPTAFDISLPPVGPIGIECRKNTGLDSTGPNVGRDHEIIVTFPVNVTVGSADARDANNPDPFTNVVGTTTFSVSNNVVTVDLHNLPRTQPGNTERPARLNIYLRSVSDGATTADVIIPMGVLFGDVNGSTRTDSGDITNVRAHSISIPTDNATARFDVTLSGRIDSGDVTAVRSYVVQALP